MSKLPVQILLMVVLSGFAANAQPAVKAEGSGLMIWNYFVKNKATKTMIAAVPPDSIYYHKGYAIEVLLKIHELTDLSGRTTASVLPNGYYFIDIPKKRFRKVNDWKDIQGNIDDSWEPLEKKNRGMNFQFKQYNGEKCAVKDTVIDRNMFQLIRYTVAFGPHKDAKLTLYARKGSFRPIPFYDLDKVLTGRLEMIEIVYPDGGEALARYDYVELPLHTPQFQAIDKAIKSGL